ncbi:glycosyl hydrolase family 18 protein [Longispora sp. NPDC051575]|uniref:glycosyl hydrolase family 18 protein n=1 Tax=Longispora sp. NPDC051575 TaxID=3154943 RepID=UPI00343CADE1
MKLHQRIAVAVAATLALPLGAAAALASTVPSAAPAVAAPSSGGVKFAYFTQWGIYQNAFYPKNMQTSGAAAKIDFMNYAFANIHPTNHTCFMANKAASQDENNPNAGDGAGDSFADYGKSYGADLSIDGVADTYNQPIAGNFNQLKKLKAKNPNMKILISIGGWTYSKYFSDAAMTDASRKKFVTSCIDMFIKGNLPVEGGYGGPGTAAGIFDGIDLDWEYPGSPGGHLGNHFGDYDKPNFTALLKEFRTQLDAVGGGKKWLTAAMPAGQDKIKYIETDKISQYLDYSNLMTYDMHGGWEATGPTNHQAPVYSGPNDPMNPVPPGNLKYSADVAVKAWTTGLPDYGIPGGFPANKITVGYPFYYRGWTGVPNNGKNGLFQTATAPAPGAPNSGNVAGTRFYKELAGFVDNPSKTFWDAESQAAYFYDGTVFWSGDSKQSVKARADYAHCNGLAGGMMYSMEGLDGAMTLFNATVDAINATTPGCVAPTTAPPTTRPPTSQPPTSQPPTSNPPTSNPPTSRPPTSNPPTTQPPTCSVAAWNAATVYSGGQQASYNGRVWKAKWWTQGETPGVAAVWENISACGPATSSPPGTCTAAAWNAATAYSGGSVVSHSGKKYRAKWWTQGETPGSAAVWEDQGACSS